MGAKEEYDSEVNSAEAYINHMRSIGIRGFTNFSMLRMSYDGWCSQEGLVPLGITSLKRAILTYGGGKRQSVRYEGQTRSWHFIDNWEKTPGNELVLWDNGMLTARAAEDVKEDKAAAPATPTPPSEAEQQTLGSEGW